MPRTNQPANSAAAALPDETYDTQSDTPDTTNLTQKQRRPRQIPTKEGVVAGFDSIITTIEGELQRIKEVREPVPKGTTKFLRSVAQQVKALCKQASRVMKEKGPKTRKVVSNCGFEKPVPISTELAKFCQWEPDQLKSRVDVTKYICKYIADHNLQNPDDRRQIRPDNKLKRLLGYDSRQDDVLRYYNIQSCLKQKNHFPK
jgi:chromatin remodeling complex protein RSC6